MFDLNDWPLNRDCYVLKMLYMNFMLTTNPKSIKDTEKKRKKPNVTLEKLINHKEREKEKNEAEKNYKKIK